MSDGNLRERLLARLRVTKDLAVLRQELVEFAAQGGASHDAESVLRELRGLVESSEDEDVILELLDIASGWCAPRMRIWQ